MSVGQRQHFLPGNWRARVRAVASTVPATIRTDRTVPAVPAVPGAAGDDPSILGFTAEVGGAEDDDVGPEQLTVSRAAHSGRVAVVRRADRLGSLLLILAGVAAGLSLPFPWVRGAEDTGLSLIQQGVDLLFAGAPDPGRSTAWAPLAVVLGGGVLALLGLLLLFPALTHRFVGLLAFVVAEVAAAGILTTVAEVDWRIARIDLGLGVAVAVPVLGLLGALKAMLTAPRLPVEAET